MTREEELKNSMKFLADYSRELSETVFVLATKLDELVGEEEVNRFLSTFGYGRAKIKEKPLLAENGLDKIK